MIDSPDTARGDLAELERILCVDAGIANDDPLWLRVAEIRIAIDGLEGTISRTSTEEVRASISAIGCAQLERRIADLAVDVLGYYALPAEPRGANEPPVGGISLQALRSKHLERLAADETRLLALRDHLAQFLLKLRPNEEET